MSSRIPRFQALISRFLGSCPQVQRLSKLKSLTEVTGSSAARASLPACCGLGVANDFVAIVSVFLLGIRDVPTGGPCIS